MKINREIQSVVAMKRSRRSSKTTITDLPEDILIDILSRLSIKTIVTCRCVSKTWCNLLSSSNPEFTKLHFTRSPVQCIHETGIDPHVYFYIVELEDDTDLDNTIKPFPSRFRLSKCDLYAVNSCNGFLCLAVNYLYPVKVCNPVTGEYLNLPKHKMYDYKDSYGGRDVASGFGCGAKTNQYKVVMLVCRKEHNPVTGFSSFGDRMVEIYTIGTKSWRNIGIAPKLPDGLWSTTFFNGAIHWLCYDKLSSNYIISFDLDSEKFGTVPPPAHFSMEPIKEKCRIKIGVLGEFLYLSYNKELWVMMQYGVQESWTKLYVIDRRLVSSHQAIKYLSGGKILMNCDGNRLFSYDPAAKISKEFKISPMRVLFRTIAHVPSFMSLNDAMMADKGAKLHTRMCRLQLKGRD